MIGVDYKINVLKTLLQDFFDDLVEDTTYLSYGRAVLNRKGENSVIPEVLTPNTNEYVPVKFNDRKDGQSFMLVDNDTDGISPIDMMGNVSLYFSVNLKKLYPTITERAGEYLIRDVMEILAYSEFDFVSYTDTLDAFNEFTNVKNTYDYQPYYLVKFSTKVEFQINENIIC